MNTGMNSDTLYFASVGTVLGVNMTFLEGNACNHLSYGNCPARIGQSFIFRLTYEMPTLLPPV